jgi:N-dimethylarginine dimethylaminohydrolase
MKDKIEQLVKDFVDAIYLHLEQYFMTVTEETTISLPQLLGHYEAIGQQLKNQLSPNS